MLCDEKINSVQKAESIEELLESCPKNQTIGDNLVRAWSKINNPNYERIKCSISGGSDSDVMLDIIWQCDKENKVDYIWFNTGLEYQATKDHLKFLEEKYGIEIKPYKAIKPIPITCKEYGQPFLSKRVSDYMSRLQAHNFQWEDEPLNALLERYCEWDEKKQDWVGCKGALQWWCNDWSDNSSFNIKRNKWLKEFIVANPPNFKISDKCCKYAKKDVGNKCIKENGYQLDVIGVRKAEGGNRKTAYKSCFDQNGNGYDNYRPLFWYKDSDKKQYDEHYNITHSRCYEEYGLKRTGCAGCPFGRDFEHELEVIQKYEPRLYKAVNNIFGESYKYTRRYREFCKQMKEKERNYNEMCE